MSENGTAESVDPGALVGRVQELTHQLEAVQDPAARNLAEELTAAIVQMYGAGLERIVQAIAEGGPAGRQIMDRLAEDGVVASLLLIHDLYPVSVEERVLQALERVRPYMESHGGNVEFLGVHENIAHLRLQGSCKSCSASSSTLELAVRQALEEAAPDLEGMEVEGVVEESTGSPFEVLQQPSWFALEAGAVPGPDGLVGTEVAGAALVVADVEGTLLAYRDRCAGCGEQLRGGELLAGALTCPGCSRSFFLPRAGRSLDGDGLQLEPVPLLREGEAVRVALSP
jgi:Fe-S cluster biogenesis protein NfuA/nitrite reductase/ring-hydroxylating ferredoxin subunit